MGGYASERAYNLLDSSLDSSHDCKLLLSMPSLSARRETVVQTHLESCIAQGCAYPLVDNEAD